LLKHQGINW